MYGDRTQNSSKLRVRGHEGTSWSEICPIPSMGCYMGIPFIQMLPTLHRRSTNFTEFEV